MTEINDVILKSAILIVDDEPANVALIEQILEEEDYTNIQSTTDPRQVYDLHRTHQFDLILLDFRMPHMNGVDVLNALAPLIQSDWTPVLVLTAQTDDQTRFDALQAGARDFLNKPFRSWEVLLRIRNMLESRHFYKRQRLRADDLEILVHERTKKIRETKLMVIERLGRAGEFRDNETGNHVLRMSKACEMLALSIGYSAHDAQIIRYASPMHDVGKIGIPDAILLKPGRLDTEERIIMNTHVTIGAEIIGDDSDDVMKIAKLMALYHHERWDGTGYPHGLQGADIPIEARIASICDVFDALTSSRPYKKAWSIEDATAFITSESGKYFDPGLVEKFMTILPDVVGLREALPD